MLFLGHHGDRDDAATLARRLQRVGVKVWCSALDERGGGGTYHEEVIRAIKEADCFVVLLGSAGLGGELTGEVSRALARQGKRPEYRIVPVALPSARKTSDGLLENPPDVLEIYLPPLWLPRDWREQSDEFFRTLATGRLGQTLEPGPFVPPEAEARRATDSRQAPEPALAPDRKSRVSPTSEGPHLGGAISIFKRPSLRRWGLISLAVAVPGLIVWLAAVYSLSPNPNGAVPARPLAWSSSSAACVAVWNHLTLIGRIDGPFETSGSVAPFGPVPDGNPGQTVQALDDYLLQIGATHKGTGAFPAELDDQDLTLLGLAGLVDDCYEFPDIPELVVRATPPDPPAPKGWSNNNPSCVAVWSFLHSAGELSQPFSAAHSVRFDAMKYWARGASPEVIESKASATATRLDGYLTSVLGARLGPKLWDNDVRARLTEHLAQPEGTPSTLARLVDELYRMRDEPVPPSATPPPDPSQADRLPLQMVAIPGGSFLMGDDDSSESDERPAHRVTVKAFELSAFEVTREQYRAVMKDVESATIPEEEWKEEEERWKQADPNLPAAELERLAAIHVSWLDAVRFCNALSAKERLTPYYTIQGESAQGSPTANGYRLPSEAEWEYACRTGSADGAEYGFGNTAASLKDYGWYFVNSGATELALADTARDLDKVNGEWGCRVHAVGKKRASAWGLHDMHGNVWEWCEDTWHENYQGAPTAGRAWIDEASVDRVVRGGSFRFTAVHARSACRDGYRPSSRWAFLGFRPARSVTAD